MHAHAVFPLLCCFLFPREIRTAPTAAAHSPALRDALERARMLADKISKDVPAAYAEVSSRWPAAPGGSRRPSLTTPAFVPPQGSTLDLPQQTGDLQMMAVALRIPPAPVLKPLSQHFDMDTCVSRMAEGVRMFQGLLGVLSTRLGGLDGLRADLRDLLTQIAKVQEAARPGGAETDRDRDRERDRWAGMAAGLHGDYEAQAAAQLTLTQLRSFAHDVIRSLRAIAAHRTLAR
ncbi:uncharacterized protein LOC133466477 isoform X2 [Phyllopteryx taeniolatus]|uniref:uncharacterized protein LOC133466477 isoform X2 n=1 Tax=Phyllopteryx taeniolatus TaxID=161469 RepID=UPI002AD27389|nr:uncharacterized protein LOC133466477 isoform X2 [Phyllopteryx taeniolatus]